MNSNSILLNPAVLISVGVLAILLGLAVRWRGINLEKQYKGKANGRILSVQTLSRRGSKGKTIYTYIPKVEYTVDGTRYETEGQGLSSSDYYQEGAELPVFYRLENPNECVTVAPQNSAGFLKFSLLIGLGLILFGVFKALK